MDYYTKTPLKKQKKKSVSRRGLVGTLQNDRFHFKYKVFIFLIINNNSKYKKDIIHLVVASRAAHSNLCFFLAVAKLQLPAFSNRACWAFSLTTAGKPQVGDHTVLKIHNYLYTNVLMVNIDITSVCRARNSLTR